MKLANKTAVVIGGVGGIGGAISRRLANEGARVYATSRTPDEPGSEIRILRADASSPVDIERVFAQVRSETGRLDILVVNAGMGGYATLEGFSGEHFDQIFGLNVRSLAFAVKAGSAHMSDGGAIVLIGSIADEVGLPGYGVYSASKAAVRSFARTWTSELAPRGIRVNVVSPGPTDTDMLAALSDEARKAMIQRIPLGRVGRPDEIAAAAVFLASEESSFITGAALCVDGGAGQI